MAAAWRSAGPLVRTAFRAAASWRVSMRTDAFPGTETRGLLKLGGRFTQGPIRYDAGFSFGLTSIDPSIGFTLGFTYVFNAFSIP